MPSKPVMSLNKVYLIYIPKFKAKLMNLSIKIECVTNRLLSLIYAPFLIKITFDVCSINGWIRTIKVIGQLLVSDALDFDALNSLILLWILEYKLNCKIKHKNNFDVFQRGRDCENLIVSWLKKSSKETITRASISIWNFDGSKFEAVIFPLISSRNIDHAFFCRNGSLC